MKRARLRLLHDMLEDVRAERARMDAVIADVLQVQQACLRAQQEHIGALMDRITDLHALLQPQASAESQGGDGECLGDELAALPAGGSRTRAAVVIRLSFEHAGGSGNLPLHLPAGTYTKGHADDLIMFTPASGVEP